MIIIQCGNVTQCSMNGIHGWAFCFGVQNNGSRLVGRQFQCARRKEVRTWNVKKEYSTSFRLELIMH